MKKIASFIIIVTLIAAFNSNLVVKAEPIEVFIDGVEDMSPEEAATYIQNYIGVPVGTYALDELTGINMISFNSKTIEVTFTTNCNLGLAEEVGVKQVSIQTREEGSNMYGNVPIAGTYCTKNAVMYAGKYSITNPKVGIYYRGKQKHYIIYNGVEYSYFTYTSEIQFTGK